MKRYTTFFKDFKIILLGWLSGYLLSLTGFTMSWLIGSMLITGIYSFFNKKENTFQTSWKRIGQMILGMGIGESLTVSIIGTLEKDWVLIASLLIATIGFSALVSLLLWRWDDIDLSTCLISTAPGGITTLPSMAEDFGSNAAVVSLFHLNRLLLVIGCIPVLAVHYQNKKIIHSYRVNHHVEHYDHSMLQVLLGHPITKISLLGLAALAGVYLAKKFKIPSPFLIGSAVGVALTHSLITLNLYINMGVPEYDELSIVAQVLIGVSVGSQFRREMLMELKQAFFLRLSVTVLFISLMILSAYFASHFDHIPFVTALLAFAPGGIAEMSATSMALHADTNLVVALQTLRLTTVLIVIPYIIKLIKRKKINLYKGTLK